MTQQHSGELAIFGKNRFNDWAILFFVTVFIMIGVIIYDILTYRDTATIVNGTTESVVIESTFDQFKMDVITLSTFLDERNGAAEIIIPTDPSLR